MDESKLTPLNTRVDPSTLRYFMCFFCGEMYYIQSDYQRHLLDHQWASLAVQLYDEEIKNERVAQKEKSRQKVAQEGGEQKRPQNQEVATDKVQNRRPSVTKSKTGETEKKFIKNEKSVEPNTSNPPEKPAIDSSKLANNVKPMEILPLNKKRPQMTISPVLFQELDKALFRPSSSKSKKEGKVKHNKVRKQRKFAEESNVKQEENNMETLGIKRRSSTSSEAKFNSAKQGKMADRESEAVEKQATPIINDIATTSDQLSEVQESNDVKEPILATKIKTEILSTASAIQETPMLEEQSPLKPKCDRCKMEFSQKYQLISHLVTSHNVDIERIVVKYYADERFIREAPLDEHEACNKCSLQFLDPSRYYVHMFTMHKDRFFSRKDTTRVHFSFLLQNMATVGEDEFELFRECS